MCGRFTLTLPDFEELARLLGVEPDAQLAARYRPRYNVAPSDAHWILAEPAGKALLPARWGHGAKKLPLLRSEGAAKRKAFADRRCVVPTDGFFEWTGEKGARKPHWFHPTPQARAKGGLLLLAGLYGEGPEGFDFAILTTGANDTVRPIHDRMPVVIAAGDVDRWLHGSTDDAASLLAPAPADLLVDTAVGTRVNSARNDDPSCLLPETQRDDARGPVEAALGQRKLFE